MCDCHENAKYGHLDETYLGLVASDQLIAKALRLNELSQIAKAELRLRKFLEGKWNQRKAQAIKSASSMARQLKSADKIAKAVAVSMNKWSGDVTKTFTAEIENVYKLARIAGYKKATGKTKASLQFNVPKTTGVENTKVEKANPKVDINFDLVDEYAIDSLNDQNIFWIGEHYDENISNSVRDVARDVMVKAGENPATAGKTMADEIKKILGTFVTPGGFIGTEKQYFEGLVANAMTVGRVYGQMRSFADIGITKYTIVNPGGTRICQVCAALQGTTFELSQGLEQISQEFSATSPQDIKKIHPWPRSVSAVSGKSPNDLASAGLALPPYHFRCRCTVDVTVESVSYETLVPVPFPSAA